MLGKNINGYKLIAFKGSGSFGSVYACVKNNITYAMKIFNYSYVLREFANGEDNRITREIAALKAVNHMNVVAYVDNGSFVENGVEYLYVVMDYLEGENLEQYAANNDLSELDILDIFRRVLDGIDAIHAQHIVHRDLKPANIYVTTTGEVKILYFGLSKLIDFTSITSTGDEIGSPLYMSPEQVKDSKNVDYRSDYYALGVILFVLLTKHHPYGKVQSRTELFYKIVNEPPISIRQYIPTISNGIDNLISVLLEKENFKRPNNISAIKSYILNNKEDGETEIVASFVPTFFLRTWNEKSVLEAYKKDGNFVENYIFPINHQNQQKNLLKLIMESSANYIIDPATMRLAYDTFQK